jgi:quercetin dioxygenase-like cupin family protein
MHPHPEDLARYRVQDLLGEAEHARLVIWLRSLRRSCRRPASQAAAMPAASNQAMAPVTVPWPAHPDQGSDVVGARIRGERTDRVVLLPREAQPVARDPSGWERRILSPVLPSVEFEFMRTTIGPGVAAGVFDPHPPGSRGYVAVEQGELELTLDGELYRLGPGDAVYYPGDGRHGVANRGPVDCVYYLAMDVTGRP